MLNTQKRFLQIHRADMAAVVLLILTAVLCHARYVLQPELLFATEGDSFRQILPTSILYQNALAAGDPFWSWSFGLGGDLFTELSYAGTTSPFTCLQFFVRALCGATGGADLVAALRWKLAFSIVKQALALTLTYALLRRERLRPAYALVGALTYGCAPWFLYRAILFDFMTDAYVLLPLAMLAFNRYRRTGRWIPLTCAVALLTGANFYFGYICCIFLASVFLLFSIPRMGGGTPAGYTKRDVPAQPGFGAYALRIGKLLGISLLGALLAAVLLFPSMNAVFSSDRTVANAQLVLLPRVDTLKNLFIMLFGGNGMFALPLICLLAVFLRWRALSDETKKHTLLAGLWLILFLIPAVSSVMNGFSYETPRWHFVVIFAVAYALPYWLSELEAGHARVRPWAVVALCGALCGLYAVFGDKTVSVAGLAWAASFLLALFCVPWTAFSGQITQKQPFARAWAAVLCACVLLCGVFNSTGVRVHNLYSDAAEEAFFGPDAAQKANFALAPTRENAFYRVHDMGVDTHGEDAEARPYVYGTYGVSNYASELNGRLSAWHKKTFRFRTTPVCAGIYQSFDDRLFADVAWAVRYKVPAAERDAPDLPSLWSPVPLDGGGTVYECALSTGFELWYDTALSEHAWLQADVAARDALLLQTAALEGERAYAYPAPQPDDVTDYLPQTFFDAQVEGGDWTADGLLVVPEQATLRWEVAPAQAEGEYLASFSIEETSGEERFSIASGGRTMDKFADTLSSESLNYPLYDYAFRYAGGETTLSMTLTKGVYRLWDLQIAFNRYDALAQWVEARNRYNFDTLRIAGSRIDGTITVGESGVLALSMPYNRGWRCLVDGRETELLAVNGIFTGIALSPGAHKLALRFTPPYLALGAAITLCTAVGLAAAAIVASRRRQCKPAESRIEEQT